MECRCNKEDNFGYIKISNVDYSEFVSVGMIRSSAWLKYLQLARDWIIDQMLDNQGSSFSFETLAISIKNTNEMCSFNSFPGNNFSPNHDVTINKLVEILNVPFQVSFKILSIQESVFTNKFVIINLSTNKILMMAVIVDKLINSNLLPSLHVKVSCDPQELHLKDEIEKLSLRSWKSPSFRVSYPVTFSYVSRTGKAKPGFYTDMCYCCANEGVKNQFTKLFPDGISKHTAKSISAEYIQNISINDVISVEMWIAKTRPLTIDFQISDTENNQLLFICKISFFECEFSYHPNL